MNSKINIPKDYTAFLYWVKERTEAYWSKDPNAVSDENEILCDEWIRGAKWIGLSEEEIDEIEENYQITFTPQHREFLRILHTIDKKEIIEHEPFEEGGEIEYSEESLFYNWKEDDIEIKHRMSRPYEDMLSDILSVNKVWLKSWGEIRPKSDETKKQIFSNWFKTLPKLVPIDSCIYVVGDPVSEMSPVCSIYGTEIIVCGWNMRHFLLRHLVTHLDFSIYEYDEEDGIYYMEILPEITEMIELEYRMAKDKKIPVLEEMILYWISSWRSYGLEDPRSGDNLRPVVSTFFAKDEV